MAAPYASVSDLESRWRPLTQTERESANVLLEDAAFWLDTWVAGLRNAVDGGNDRASEGAKLVSVSIVRRAMQARERDIPEGVDSVSHTAGIYSEQIRYKSADGNLFIYASELADLLAVVTGRGKHGAVSVYCPGLLG